MFPGGTPPTSTPPRGKRRIPRPLRHESARGPPGHTRPGPESRQRSIAHCVRNRAALAMSVPQPTGRIGSLLQGTCGRGAYQDFFGGRARQAALIRLQYKQWVGYQYLRNARVARSVSRGSFSGKQDAQSDNRLCRPTRDRRRCTGAMSDAGFGTPGSSSSKAKAPSTTSGSIRRTLRSCESWMKRAAGPQRDREFPAAGYGREAAISWRAGRISPPPRTRTGVRSPGACARTMSPDDSRSGSARLRRAAREWRRSARSTWRGCSEIKRSS